jgi:hypothetical protein
MPGLTGAVKVYHDNCGTTPTHEIIPEQINVAPRNCLCCNKLTAVLYDGECGACLPDLAEGEPSEKLYADFLYEHFAALDIECMAAINFIEVGDTMLSGFAHVSI